jgi:thioredoxin-like negative regulator of GroEL
MLKPAIERLAEANPDIDIVDIDANIHYDICNDFQLSGVPAVLFFKNGELKAKIDGAQRMSDYQEKIDALK